MADPEAADKPEQLAGDEATNSNEEGSNAPPDAAQASTESEDVEKDATPSSPPPPETGELKQDEKPESEQEEQLQAEQKQDGETAETEIQEHEEAAGGDIPPPLPEADADAPPPANTEGEQPPPEQESSSGPPEGQVKEEEEGSLAVDQGKQEEEGREAEAEEPTQQEENAEQGKEEVEAEEKSSRQGSRTISPAAAEDGGEERRKETVSASSKGRREAAMSSRGEGEEAEGSEILRGASSSRMESAAASRAASKKTATPSDESRALRAQLEEYKSRCRIVEDDRAELERLVRDLRLKADAEGQARQRAEAAKESAEEELRYKATVKEQAESAAQSQITQLESVIESLKLQLGEIQDQENIVTELRERVDKAEREISEKDLQFTRVQAEMERRVQQQYQLLMRNRSYMESVGRRKINISANLQNALTDMRSKRKEQEEMGSMLEGLIKKMDNFIAEESSRMNDLSDIKNTLSTLRRDDMNLETLEQLEVKLRQEKDGAQNDFFQERRLEDELLAQMLPRDSNMMGGMYPPSYNPGMGYGMPEAYRNGMNKLLEGNRDLGRYGDNMEYMAGMMRNGEPSDLGAPASNLMMNGGNGRMAPNGGGAWPMYMPPYAGGPLGEGMEFGYGMAKPGYAGYGQYGGEPMGRGYDVGEIEMIHGSYNDLVNARPPSGKPVHEMERMAGRGQGGGAFKFPPIGAGPDQVRQDAKGAGGSKASERKLKAGKAANEGSERERVGGKDSRQQELRLRADKKKVLSRQ
uniref:Uncharacterized protein n=1 Tax=Hanusia phi TaxID=3032 RepID=A0A7S0EHU0_9CRYP|mmetsp:Transcript_24340/g.54824  ORF Transcript_24340/g.54824 Transcript_24340/m.54824 type:complete len:755 (+) Transcript_24340:77-2341(+)